MYQSRWAPKQPTPENESKSSEALSTLSAAAQTFAPAPSAPQPDPQLVPDTIAEPKSAPEPLVASEPMLDQSHASVSEAGPEPVKDLVAAAPQTEDIYQTATDVSNVDEFAQTGAADDDLFDDFIPMDQSMRVRSDDDLFSDDFTPAPQPIVEQPAPRPVDSRANAVRGRDRGRGRGRGAPRTDVKTHAPTQSQPHPVSTDVPEHVPTGPRQEPVRSVRGDRQATGGIKKPKLTEEELAEKMAQIQIKNASLTAAHARAEADAATFAQRESQAKTDAARRQREERRDRQQMMGEREKNRMRKLKAMDGRQWDAEKNEEDFSRGGQFDKKGGFTQREDHDDGREYIYKEPRGGAAGRGARGGKKASEAPQRAPKAEEFPALPGGIVTDLEAAPKTSWADQVENA